jgi:hypothetical protein
MCSAWLRRWGEPDRAIAALQKLLSIPYNGALAATLTPALLRLDPMFDPLRNDPRFQKRERPALLRLDPIWDSLRSDPAFQKLCEEKK